MCEARQVLLTGATGLVGTQVVLAARAQRALRLTALVRREGPASPGSSAPMRVAQPAVWPEVIAALAPRAVICALGTTMRQAGSEAAFRAVDHDLVLSVAQAASEAGAENFVLVSSVGADLRARTLYLRVKGETEAALAKLGFHRLDILRPGLLRGTRTAELRVLERLADFASPVSDRLLHGAWRRYRSIPAETVAAAALRAAVEPAPGCFIHEHDAIRQLAGLLDHAA